MDSRGETIRLEEAAPQSTESTEAGFDGELVVIADAEFDEKINFPVIFTDRYRERTYSLDKSVCALLAKYNALAKGLFHANPTKLEDLEAKTNALYVNLMSMWGREVLDTILSGRIRVALLIDSDGGYIEEVEIYKRAMSYLLGKGGISEAFVTGHAGSAGFELMASAQNIFLMKDAHLMWHFSDDEGDRRNQVETLREKRHDQFRKFHELADLYKFLERSPYYNMAVKSRFYAEITDPKNPEGELTFTPEELYKMEIANNMYDDLPAMSAEFSYCYDAVANKAVRDFWLYSDIMAREATKANNWADKNFEERRQQLRSKKIAHRNRRYKRLFPTM